MLKIFNIGTGKVEVVNKEKDPELVLESTKEGLELLLFDNMQKDLVIADLKQHTEILAFELMQLQLGGRE